MASNEGWEEGRGGKSARKEPSQKDGPSRQAKGGVLKDVMLKHAGAILERRRDIKALKQLAKGSRDFRAEFEPRRLRIERELFGAVIKCLPRCEPQYLQRQVMDIVAENCSVFAGGSCRLGLAGSTAISETLRFNTSLTCIKLTDDRLGKTGGPMLASAIRDQGNIRELVLAHNNLGNVVGKAFFRALRGCTSIRTFRLVDSKMQCYMLAVLSNFACDAGSLEHFDIVGDDSLCSVQAARALSSVVSSNPNLSSLTLSGLSMRGQHGPYLIGRAIQHHPALKDVNIHRCMYDAGLAKFLIVLKDPESVERISLYGNHMRFECRKALLGMAEESTRSVRRLSISKGALLEPALSALIHFVSRNSEFEELDVGNGNTLDESRHIDHVPSNGSSSCLQARGPEGPIATMGSHKGHAPPQPIPNRCLSHTLADWLLSPGTTFSLPSLIVRRNDVGSDGVTSIALSLSKGLHLRELDLSRAGDNTCSRGIGRLGAALSYNSTLKKLDLSHNQIEDEDVEDFVREFWNWKLRELRLSHNCCGARSARALGKLLAHSSVEVIALDHNTLECEGCVALTDTWPQRALDRRISLDLCSNKIHDRGIVHLANNPGFRNICALFLADNPYGNASMTALRSARWPHQQIDVLD